MNDDELVDELLAATRTFVGVAVRSIAGAPVDITVAQHRLLVRLAERGPQQVGELAAFLGVNQSNASRQCDRLQRLGLVTRRRSAADGRVVDVALTEDGARVVEAVTRSRRDQLAALLERMEVAEAASLSAALRAFNAAAEEAERDRP